MTRPKTGGVFAVTRGSAFGVVRKSLPVDHHARFVADNPRIMARRHTGEVPRPEVHLFAVVHHHLHPTRDEVSCVSRLTALGLGDRLHVLRPLPTRKERGTTDGTSIRIHQLESAFPPSNGLVSSGESRLLRIRLAIVTSSFRSCPLTRFGYRVVRVHRLRKRLLPADRMALAAADPTRTMAYAHATGVAGIRPHSAHEPS